MNGNSSQPPRLAEAMLYWLAAQECIIGDFAEEFEMALGENGRFQAKIWYWQQFIRSTPALCQRRWQTSMTPLTKRDKQFLIFSVLSLIPAMLIGIPGVLFSVFGLAGPMNAVFGTLEGSVWVSWLLHPLTIMGGIALAFLLTAWPVIQLEVNNQQGQLISLTLRKGYWLHLAVLGTAVLFMLLIFAYLLAENLQIFQLFV